MVTINLYQAGTMNEYVQLPSEWGELLPEEILMVCKHLLTYAADKDVAKGLIFQGLAESRARLQKIDLPKNWMELMDPEQVVLYGYPLLDYLYDDNTLLEVAEKSLTPALSKGEGGTPIAKRFFHRLFSTTFYAPDKGFENLTCGEFEDAEIFFYEFNDQPNQESLAKLAAVLYRPHPSPLLVRGWNANSQRVPYITCKGTVYSSYDSVKRVSLFMQMEPWRLYAIYVWYLGCRRRLPRLFPNVYSAGGDSGGGEPDMLAFTKCIHGAAGVKNGTRNEVRMTKVLELFFEMEQESIKAKELAAEYEEGFRV